MKNAFAVVVAGIVLAGAAFVSQAGEPVDGGKDAAKPAIDKAKLMQDHEQEQVQKYIEISSKEIADIEVKVKKIKDLIASGKSGEKQLYLEKQIQNLEQSSELLRQIKKALEVGDITQAKILREKLKDLKVDWSIAGEKKALFDSEKAQWASRLGDGAPADLQGAWDTYSKTTETLFAMSKEVRELERKRMEARKLLEKAWHEYKKADKAGANKAASK